MLQPRPVNLSANKLLIQEVLTTATKEAAIAVAPHVGKGDKIAADQAAVDTIGRILSDNDVFSCEVVMGEGVKDEAPMLAHGHVLGHNFDSLYDLAVDPIEGTTFVANGQDGGLSIVALAEKDQMLPWAGIRYMKKLFVGPKAKDLLTISGDVRLNGDPETNLRLIAEALGKKASELVIAALLRDRNSDILNAAAKIGAHVIGLSGGDVLPAISTCFDDSEVDVLYSSGGSPEGVIATAAVEILGGGSQLMWDPQNDKPIERRLANERGELGKVLFPKSIVGQGELHVAFTAITPYQDKLTGVSLDDAGNGLPGDTFARSRA